MALNKKQRRERIKFKIRKTTNGTAITPRLSVFRSNTGISAQLINDLTGTTILAVGSNDKTFKDSKTNKIDQAKLVGKLIAEKATTAGINTIVFDRNGYLYHGRIKSLAEGAREAGLKF